MGNFSIRWTLFVLCNGYPLFLKLGSRAETTMLNVDLIDFFIALNLYLNADDGQNLCVKICIKLKKEINLKKKKTK